MRVLVLGATDNVGFTLAARLSADPEVTEVVAVARRALEAVELGS